MMCTCFVLTLSGNQSHGKNEIQDLQSLNTLLGVYRDSDVSFGGIVKDQESMTSLSNFLSQWENHQHYFTPKGSLTFMIRHSIWAGPNQGCLTYHIN